MATEALPGEKVSGGGGPRAVKPIDRSKLARAGTYLPNAEIGPSLEESGLEGTEIVIIDVVFEPRRGQNGDYVLSIITLDDGVTIHTGSKVIQEQMEKITEAGGFPCLATFVRVQSQSNKRNSYWTVS